MEILSTSKDWTKADVFQRSQSRMFNAPDALICQAFRGEAEVFYCEPLITQQMGASGSAQRVKIFQPKKKTPWAHSVTDNLLLLFNLTK
jgi:hypothetical protein